MAGPWGGPSAPEVPELMEEVLVVLGEVLKDPFKMFNKCLSAVCGREVLKVLEVRGYREGSGNLGKGFGS